MDRVAKPALYARAGIPYYWRVESEGGIVVHTHRLNLSAKVYAPTGSFDKTLEVTEPWPLRVPIDEITPRSYRG